MSKTHNPTYIVASAAIIQVAGSVRIELTRAAFGVLADTVPVEPMEMVVKEGLEPSAFR